MQASKALSPDEMRDVIRAKVKRHGTTTAAAAALSVTPQLLTMILSGERAVSDDLAALLGFQRHEQKVSVTVVFYTPY